MITLALNLYPPFFPEIHQHAQVDYQAQHQQPNLSASADTGFNPACQVEIDHHDHDVQQPIQACAFVIKVKGEQRYPQNSEALMRQYRAVDGQEAYK